jgi:phage gp36-like protein
MAPYCTQDDLVARFGAAEILALSDLEGSGSIDAARVTQMIADASATIDGYLGGRYQLPLTDTPEMLNTIAANMARYNLMGTRPTDEAADRNKNALAWLDKVAKGVYSLGVDGAGNTPAPEKAVIKHGRSTFDDRKLAGFVNDHGGGPVGDEFP